MYIKESGSGWYSIEKNTKLEFKRKIRFARILKKHRTLFSNSVFLLYNKRQQKKYKDKKMDETQTIIILMIIAAFIGIIIHFIPTIIAFKRDAASRWIIFLVNLFFGWTVVVWLVALIWACEGRTNK